MPIADFQQLSNKHVSEMSTFQDVDEKLLHEEHEEAYDLGYLTGYAWRDHVNYWILHNIYEEIVHTNFPHLQHLLDEISNLEVERERICPQE